MAVVHPRIDLVGERTSDGGTATESDDVYDTVEADIPDFTSNKEIEKIQRIVEDLPSTQPCRATQ